MRAHWLLPGFGSITQGWLYSGDKLPFILRKIPSIVNGTWIE